MRIPRLWFPAPIHYIRDEAITWVEWIYTIGTQRGETFAIAILFGRITINWGGQTPSISYPITRRQ